jgi:iron complex transport system substrate-binding protein
MTRVVLLASLALALLAGCGSEPTEPSSSAPAKAGAFPATIKHKFGETTIASQPKRIVVVGLRE